MILFVFGSCQNDNKEVDFLISKNQKIIQFYQNGSDRLINTIPNYVDTLIDRINIPIFDDFLKINKDCNNLFPLIEEVNTNDSANSVTARFVLNPKNYAKNYPVYHKPDMLKDNNNELQDMIRFLFNNFKENKVSEKLFKSEMKKILARYRYKVLAEFAGHFSSPCFHFQNNFVVANCDYKKYKKDDTIKLSVFQVYDKYNFDFKVNSEIIEKDNYKASFYSKTPEIKGELEKIIFDSLVVRYPFYKKL